MHSSGKSDRMSHSSHTQALGGLLSGVPLLIYSFFSHPDSRSLFTHFSNAICFWLACIYRANKHRRTRVNKKQLTGTWPTKIQQKYGTDMNSNWEFQVLSIRQQCCISGADVKDFEKFDRAKGMQWIMTLSYAEIRRVMIFIYRIWLKKSSNIWPIKDCN